MRFLREMIIAVASASALLVGSPALGLTTVGGYVFEDNAFADAVTLPTLNYLVWTGVGNAQTTSNISDASAVLTDNPAVNSLAAATVASCDPFTVAASDCGIVDFLFTDNVIVNGPGPDFIVFDVNRPNIVSVHILNTTLDVLASNVGAVACPPNLCAGNSTWGLNAADFDLSDFGIADGDVVKMVTLNWGVLSADGSRVGVSLIGALNSQSAPEPATLALLGVALAGVGLSRRRKRH